MITKKRYLIIILSAALIGLMVLTACSDDKPEYRNSSDDGLSLEEAADNLRDLLRDNEDNGTSTINIPEENLSLSQILFDFNFNLDGGSITLPILLEEFQAYGWESVFPLVETIGSRNHSSATFVRNDKSVSVGFVNISDTNIPIYESIVYEIRSSSHGVIELPKGIKLGISTKDDIINAFGGPSYFDDGYYDADEYEYWMTYARDTSDSLLGGGRHFIQFFINEKENNVVTDISITYGW